MKVVLLAGGLGTRMREETEFRPKPMVEIGGEPLLWHIMKIFAHHGHADFIISSGYKSEMIEDYFAPENWKRKASHLSTRFPTSGKPEEEWSITVVNTGLETPTGGRLKKILRILQGERFLVTYGDGIAPVNISQLVKEHEEGGSLASVTLARPTSRFGIAHLTEAGLVSGFREKPILDELVSIGFFIFEPSVLDIIDEESALEEEPLQNLAATGQLRGYIHDGFWQPIDTYRELLAMQKLWTTNTAPWKP
jgi:glucose-1-phosphate cytidylyltransferase